MAAPKRHCSQQHALAHAKKFASDYQIDVASQIGSSEP